MKFIALVLSVCCMDAMALNAACKLGVSDCIPSQGTEIPKSEAETVLDLCEDFTRDDLGRVVIRLSQKEILDQAHGRLTPLTHAWYAYGELIDSALRFERKEKPEETRYVEIKRACTELARDFENHLRRTK